MMEEILIDDSHMRNSVRETAIVNVGKTREAIESLDRWEFIDPSQHRHLIKTKAIVMMDLAK